MTAFLVLMLASGVVASAAEAAEAVADDRSAIITLLQASIGASEAAVKQMKEPNVGEAKRTSLRQALDKLNHKADSAARVLPEDSQIQALAFRQALAAEDWERCRRYGGASLSKAETARDSNAQAAAWVMLGQTAALEGDYERAVREAEKALSLHPEDKDATLLHQYAKGRRKAVPAGASAAQAQASNAADVAANAAAQASISAGKSLLKGLAPPPDPEAGHENSARRAVRLAGMFALTLSGGLLLTMGAWGRVFEEKFPGARLRMGWAAALCGALAAGGAYFVRPTSGYSASLGALAPGEKMKMLDEGEFVNRVWHSQAGNLAGASKMKGASYCYGACLPINAVTAIQRRGLNIPQVVNDAERGAVFRLTRRIPVRARPSIGGTDLEIVIDEKYQKYLQIVDDSKSIIPGGHKP